MRGYVSHRAHHLCGIHSLLEIDQGLDGLFDGGDAIETVAVVQVNSVDTESLQAGVTSSPSVLWIRPDSDLALIGNEAEFGRDEDVIPLSGALEPFSDDVFTILIGIGGVPESLTSGVGVVQECYRLFEGASLTIRATDAHETETHGTDFWAITANSTLRSRHCEYAVMYGCAE